jgi:co-chaperonin GroES (HSP10)
MTVNVTPLHDRVLVRRLEDKNTAKGGIIIQDTAKEKPQEGEVMEIKIDDQEYLILREEEIFGKLNGMVKAATGRR